jgi:hypothetical protein
MSLSRRTAWGRPSPFATTEHFNLQTARVATISEADGRASIYLAALSSNLIALAFIGQMSRLGTAFRAFAGTVAISSSCLHVDLIARNAPSGSGRGGRTAAQSSTGRGTTSTSRRPRPASRIPPSGPRSSRPACWPPAPRFAPAGPGPGSRTRGRSGSSTTVTSLTYPCASCAIPRHATT